MPPSTKRNEQRACKLEQAEPEASNLSSQVSLLCVVPSAAMYRPCHKWRGECFEWVSSETDRSCRIMIATGFPTNGSTNSAVFEVVPRNHECLEPNSGGSTASSMVAAQVLNSSLELEFRHAREARSGTSKAAVDLGMRRTRSCWEHARNQSHLSFKSAISPT